MTLTTQPALVIEDDSCLSEIFRRALQDIFSVETFDSGTAALKWLTVNVPQLVLLDLHLPQGSGEAILDYLAANTHFSETIIIIVSADTGLIDRLQSKADAALYKPISVSQLREVVSLARLQAHVN